jgi:hypothetical protein
VFDDELDLIRVGGRLQFADLPEETKHQIVLPAKHPVVENSLIPMKKGRVILA